MGKPNGQETETPRTIIHIEAEVGSSIFDFHIENADPIQILGVAEALHAHGNVALAQMTAETRRSPIDVVRGAMPGLRQ